MKGKVRSLRLQVELWERIGRRAREHGLSVNAYCARELERVSREVEKEVGNEVRSEQQGGN